MCVCVCVCVCVFFLRSFTYPDGSHRIARNLFAFVPSRQTETIRILQRSLLFLLLISFMVRNPISVPYSLMWSVELIKCQMNRIRTNQSQSTRVPNQFQIMANYLHYHLYVFCPWRKSPQWARASSLSRLHIHTQTHHTREGSSGRVCSSTQRPLPDNTQQPSLPLAGF